VADWSPYTGSLVWPWKRLEARRQNRLAEFVRPRLDPDEQIIAILSRVYERMTSWGGFGVLAVVVTSQRLFVIRPANMILLRSTKIVVTYSRDSVNAKWNHDARSVSSQGGTHWFGKLSLTGSLGATELWVTRLSSPVSTTRTLTTRSTSCAGSIELSTPARRSCDRRYALPHSASGAQGGFGPGRDFGAAQPRTWSRLPDALARAARSDLHVWADPTGLNQRSPPRARRSSRFLGRGTEAFDRVRTSDEPRDRSRARRAKKTVLTSRFAVGAEGLEPPSSAL
jgi:hypothetical protein